MNEYMHNNEPLKQESSHLAAIFLFLAIMVAMTGFFYRQDIKDYLLFRKLTNYVDREDSKGAIGYDSSWMAVVQCKRFVLSKKKALFQIFKKDRMFVVAYKVQVIYKLDGKKIAVEECYTPVFFTIDAEKNSIITPGVFGTVDQNMLNVKEDVTPEEWKKYQEDCAAMAKKFLPDSIDDFLSFENPRAPLQ